MNTITYFRTGVSESLAKFESYGSVVGIAGGVVVKFVIIYRTKNARKYRLGVEYGSARWSA